MSPAEKNDDAARSQVLAEINSYANAEHGSVASSVLPVATLRGAHRYSLVKKLGEGGQGAVYEAEDLDTRRRVAIKLLRNVREGALARFKREFRVRERIRHRSLVELGELACFEERWFFSMTLVEGLPLLAFIRSWPRSEPKLRACFSQLADGLVALHAAGLVHRDVKSENVMVESDGRVVLLDLGLAIEVEPDHSTELIGTPPSMAPELWAGAAPSAKSDWYSFGVLLFEALAGSAPFSGSQVELFLAKTQNPLPSLRTHLSDPPEDLERLCEGLLRPDPRDRFDATEVSRCFPPLTAAPTGAPDLEFRLVGRDAELERLDALLARTAQGHGALVFVQGPSGIGKTALLQAFAERAAAHGAWVLAGRCYENESVPFNAFDEALDGLARTLARDTRRNLDVYRPRRANLMARVFPALAALEAKRGSDSVWPLDPVEVRAQGVRAFLELLARMGEDGPVLVCLDDVQWADADSVQLMTELVQSDFPVLLVASLRDGAHERSRVQALAPDCVIQVSPLDPGATRALAASLSENLNALAPDVFDALHVETGGSPFLIWEWAHYVENHRTVPTRALRDLIAERLAQLSDEQRRLVLLVAISGEPIEVQLAARIAAADPVSDLSPLRRERLLRRLNRDGVDYVDIYHDRIRAVALDVVGPDEKRELHQRVAFELEQLGAPAERRIAHRLAAGERDRAAELALEGASKAEETLAFARAAELYELALGLVEPHAAESITLAVKKARAWQNALQPKLAGEALFDAARRCQQPERASELLRLAGEQLLLGGDVERGLAAVEQGLRDHGLELASSNEHAIVEAFTLYAELEARGLEPAAPERDSGRAARAKLCLSIARSLHHVDLRGIPFALRGLLEALATGELAIVQEAYAVFVMVTASHLPNALVVPALDRCRRLVTQSVAPYASALCEMASAELAQSQGEYAAAERACDRAERILLTGCIGVSRELGQVRCLALIMLHSNRGDFRSNLKRALEWLEDADRRQDVFHANWLRAACSLAWMAEDSPQRARAELARAEATWPAARGGTFEAACALYLDAIDRYEDCSNVYERPAQGRASVLESLVAQTPLLQGYLHVQRAWGCLRELGARPHTRTAEQRDSLRAGAATAVAGLRALSRPEWSAAADAFEANLCVLEQGYDQRADDLLERAHATFRDVHHLAWAACARRRRGELARGEVGARWVAEADTELERLGVKVPRRFAQAYFSLFN